LPKNATFFIPPGVLEANQEGFPDFNPTRQEHIPLLSPKESWFPFVGHFVLLAAVSLRGQLYLFSPKPSTTQPSPFLFSLQEFASGDREHDSGPSQVSPSSFFLENDANLPLQTPHSDSFSFFAFTGGIFAP